MKKLILLLLISVNYAIADTTQDIANACAEDPANAICHPCQTDPTSDACKELQQVSYCSSHQSDPACSELFPNQDSAEAQQALYCIQHPNDAKCATQDPCTTAPDSAECTAQQHVSYCSSHQSDPACADIYTTQVEKAIQDNNKQDITKQPAWGCAILLCLANPNGWASESSCKPPVYKLFHHLFEGKPWPSCSKDNSDSHDKSKLGVSHSIKKILIDYGSDQCFLGVDVISVTIDSQTIIDNGIYSYTDSPYHNKFDNDMAYFLVRKIKEDTCIGDYPIEDWTRPALIEHLKKQVQQQKDAENAQKDQGKK